MKFSTTAPGQEGRQMYLELVKLNEDVIEPSEWGEHFPRQFDGYKRTVDTERTRFGGSEAFQRLDADPRPQRIFAGYAFGIDYREERGHAYSLEARKLVTHPVVCLDCHGPKSMALRVTHPGFLAGIRAFKKTQGVENYDPNAMATRQEMHSFVCGQCHVEYYFAGPGEFLTYPWSKGLKVEEIEAHYDEARFSDWTHAGTGAGVLKAQHPEFEMWNQGIHARSGVACAGCHMPCTRQGAIKISDHHVRSPLLNTEGACLVCHPFSTAEMKACAETIQDRNVKLLARAEDALVALINDIRRVRGNGAGDAQPAEALKLQRRAQFRSDFINAENSNGFHTPQEAARILGEAIDYARQGQLALRK